MKLLAIVSDNTEKASTKYRAEQYLPLFKKHGINVEFVRRSDLDSLPSGNIESFDVVINFRCLFSIKTAQKIVSSAQRTIFDFDDAIYTRPGKPHSFITAMRVKKRLHYWLNHADTVTVSNNILATYALAYSENVKFIKMSLDTNTWKPKHRNNKRFITVGWAGSPTTIHHLEEIDDVLVEVLANVPNVKVAVYSGAKPNLKCKFEYHPYKPEGELGFVQSLDIGLLPMTYDEFARGKSPIKGIQYLACGIPVVGNAEGGTAEILKADHSFSVNSKCEWIECVSNLVSDRELRNKIGLAGRQFVEKYHSLDRVFAQMMKVIKVDKESVVKDKM